MQICCRLLRLTTAITLLSAGSLFAAGPNRGTNSNNGQAALHITAIIVPTVLLPPARNNQPKSAVTYNVPTLQIPLTVTRTTRPLLETMYREAVLKTVTVVAR